MPTATARINNQKQKQKKYSDMKRYRLIEYAYLATLVLGVTACSQDELSSPTGGVEGAMTFTASGIVAQQSATTRATTDGIWESDMTVGIMIDGVVKAYSVVPNTADNTKATLSATDPENPFYWQSMTAPVNVTAWYPYIAGEDAPPAVEVYADQSTAENYDDSDHIIAEQDVTYGNPILAFKHRTAKVTINIKMSVESSTAKVANLQLCNLTGVKEGTQVTPYQPDKNVATFEALLPEQTIAEGTQFLSLQLDGQTFSYIWTAAQDYNLPEGCNTVFTFRLQNKDLIFEGCTLAEWKPGQGTEGNTGLSSLDYIIEGETYKVYTEAGLKVWADHVNAGNWSTNLTLMNDITMTTPASGSSNWTPIGYRSDGQYSDKYAGTIEGNGHTIDNMVVNTPSENFAAMIVTLSGTVQNLTIGSSSSFHAKHWAASVTTNNNGGKVINCHSAATVALTLTQAVSWGDGSIGGVVANNRGDDGNSYVIGCSFSGQLTADAGSITESIFVGGVVGSSWTTGNGNQVQVVGCVNTGGMIFRNAGSTTTSRVGGVVGSNYRNGSDQTYVTGCVMAGKMTFESSVTKREREYSAFAGTIGHTYGGSTAMHVYRTSESIASSWSNPYRAGSSNSVLAEVDGTDITWETATANINTAIKDWNAANGDLCPYHFEQTNGTNQPPTLVDGAPN